MDLYLIILPLYVVLLISTLVYLKLSVQELSKNERDQTNSKKKGLLEQYNVNQQQKKGKSRFCHIFMYLMKQFTIFILFRGRRALLGLFIYSIISIFLYFGQQFWYIAPSFGIFISLVVFTIEVIEERKISQKQQVQPTCCQNKWMVSNILYSLCGIMTLSFYLTMCALIYRNYVNSKILHFIEQLGIVFTIDQFGVRPVIFLVVSLITKGNVTVLALIRKVESQQMVVSYRVANNFERQGETKNKLVFNLQIEPQPIDITKHNPSIKNVRALQKIPSSSIIQGIQFYEGSCQNILSHNESNKSNMSHCKKRIELSELQLQKIQECENDQLKQYFCLNVRKQKKQQQNKQLQAKIVMKQNKSNVEMQKINNEFILQNFAVVSPSKKEEFTISEEKHQNLSVRSNSFCKSKGSIRGVKVAKQLAKEPNEHNNQYYDQRQDTVLESTKNDGKSQFETTQNHKDAVYMSRGRHNKTNILKVHEQFREAGQLQQIDINSPMKRKNFNQTFCDETTIIEDMKRKRHRRRTSKIDSSQPYINTNKLLQIYCPNQNKSELDTYLKKQSIDRTFFNRTHKKSYSKGRDKPIVHEHDENQPQFYIPNF